VNLDGKDNYVLLETEGRGQYVGCFFYVDTNLGGWWGEGDDMIFIDHSPMPAIYGTGSEDYFNNAWGFDRPFSYPYYGAPLLAKRADGEYSTLYRFHIPDPIHFKTHIKVTMECWWLQTQTISLASVAFWYQDKPVTSRAPLPVGSGNHPRLHPLAPEDRWKHGDGGPAPGQHRVGSYQLEEPAREAGLDFRIVATINPHVFQVFGGGAAVIQSSGRELALPIPVPDDGHYRVEVKPLYMLLEGSMTMSVGAGPKITANREVFPNEDKGPFLLVGEAQAENGRLILTASGAPVITIQGILLTKL
jgi:hypothetical protein